MEHKFEVVDTVWLIPFIVEEVLAGGIFILV